MPFMHVLVTGGAGFIGSHLVDRLLSEGRHVTVLDTFDPFYDPSAKRRNLAPHHGNPRFRLIEGDIRAPSSLGALGDGRFNAIVHLAARAGVRPSLHDPLACDETNVRGTRNLLELAGKQGIPRFVFASSSSVYGINPHVPWREDDAVLRPISPYAATKVSGEMLGHVYSHLHGIRFVALRLFTAYGPRQRPDLAMHAFARRMLAGEALPFFGDGSTRRDYTYIDDIVAGIVAALAYDGSMYEVINLGNNQTVSLSDLVRTLEDALGVHAVLDRLPEQAGDVPCTWADITKARHLLGYTPATPFEEGVQRFAAWLRGGSPG
jgi:UDP-glucuronate 4-epimerase